MSDGKTGGPVSVSKDGKVEITDPALLDKVAGGAGEPGGEDPDTNVGCANAYCPAQDEDIPTPT